VRVFEPTAKATGVLAPLVAVGGAAAWFQPAVTGGDLWWHLASGRAMWAQLSICRADPFSFTFQGRGWINHEWLWDVVSWAVYRVHPQAVAWLQLGVIAATFSLTYVVSRRASASRLAAGAMLWLVAACAHWYLDIRPHVLTLLMVNVFLLTRERPWAPWLWPPLVVAWVNLHGGFIFGVGAIGLHVLVRTLEARLGRRRAEGLGREWLGVALCLAATMANPYGYHIFEGPLAYLDTASPYRGLAEWRGPGFSLDPRGFAGRFWLVALAAALGAPSALRRDRYLLALTAVTFAMALGARRFIPLFAITAAPLGAMAIAWARQRLVGLVRPLGRPEAGLACAAAAGLAAAVLWLDVRLYPRLLDRWTNAGFFPQAALRYVQAMGAPLRVLNSYNWGGYIMLHAPQMQVFIDGRANTLYDDGIYLDYLAFLSGGPGIHQGVSRYGADAALLPTGGRFARALGSGPGAWTVVYADDVAAVLLPPGSPLLAGELPGTEAVPSDLPDFHVSLGRAAFDRGDLDDARRHWQRALELDPLLARTYGYLAACHAAGGDLDAAARVISDGIREIPRRAAELRLLEGRAYARVGATQRALDAFRKAMPRGPFHDPSWVEQRIRDLEEPTAGAG
jgi:tetratricopeptide (TPR) repeat protein